MTQIGNISFFGIRARPHMFDRLFAYQTWRETFSGQDNKTYGELLLAGTNFIHNRPKMYPTNANQIQLNPNVCIGK